MHVFCKVVTLAVFALLAACGKSGQEDSARSKSADKTRAPIKVTTAAPASVDKALWADIGWFPADIRVITEMTRKDRMLPMVSFIKNMARSSKWPPCAFEHLNQVQRYYLAARSMSSTSTIVFFADVDRSRVDACARTVVAKPSLHGKVVTRGAVTQLHALGNKGFLGWVDLSGTRVTVFDTDAKRVDAFLGAAKRLDAKHPLVRPLTGADRKADQWVAGAADLGSQYFGIASSTFLLQMRFLGEINKGKAVPLVVTGWIDFDLDTKAKEALARMEKALAAIGDDLPLPVLQQLKRTVDGSRLRIDIKVDTNALTTVMRWIGRASKTMRGLSK